MFSGKWQVASGTNCRTAGLSGRVSEKADEEGNTAEITENTKEEEKKVSRGDAEARRNKAKVVFRSADL